MRMVSRSYDKKIKGRNVEVIANVVTAMLAAIPSLFRRIVTDMINAAVTACRRLPRYLLPQNESIMAPLTNEFFP